MEVNIMYVDNVGASRKRTVAAGTKTNTSGTASAKVTKAATADSAVKTESTDGGTQLNNKNSSNPAKTVTAAYEAGNEKKVADEKRLADNEKIRKTIESFRAQLTNSEVKFGIHERTNRVTIKIVDKNTDEVIKEIPPEKTLDMIAKCMEIAGVLVDERL
ncbi:MAG: flagellar protein FlaG [Lachnospiraceae bacterium]